MIIIDGLSIKIGDTSVNVSEQGNADRLQISMPGKTVNVFFDKAGMFIGSNIDETGVDHESIQDQED